MLVSKLPADFTVISICIIFIIAERISSESMKDVFCVEVSLDCNLSQAECSKRIQSGLFVTDVTVNDKTKLFSLFKLTS